jgi:hypothetical protein
LTCDTRFNAASLGLLQCLSLSTFFKLLLSFSFLQLIHLAAWPLTRDTLFYAVSLGLLVGVYADYKIYWWEDIILILW